MSVHGESPDRNGPRRVAVVGAGMVGLATAWFLQEAGVQVTVYERDRVAAGASWGNAGWLTPGLVAPLPEPAVLRYGLRAVVSPRSPVYLPLRADGVLLRFLASFVRHSTDRHWRRGLAALRPLTERALEAFGVLAAGGVAAPTHPAAPLLACFRDEGDADALLVELRHIRDAGHPDLDVRVVGGPHARAHEPVLTTEVRAAVEIHGQRYLQPPEYVDALARAVRERGGEVAEGVGVRALHDEGGGVTVVTAGGELRHDAVVVATGAELGRLAGRFGVRCPV